MNDDLQKSVSRNSGYMQFLRLTFIVFFVLGVTACGSDKEAAVDLPSPELFTWGSQPISVSPPPDTWRRDKAQSGGLRGVRFIKNQSIGEEISIAEHYALDERLRCTELTELLRDLDNLSDRDFNRRIQRASLYVPKPINSSEKRQAEKANAELTRARTAFRNKQPDVTRHAITNAFEDVGRIKYSLDDVVERVMFDKASYDSFGEVFAFLPKEVVVAGEPGVSVDFTLDPNDRDVKFHGRQVYVLKNNRLFVLTFFGLPENIPVFEQIVASVSFPPSQCVL